MKLVFQPPYLAGSILAEGMYMNNDFQTGPFDSYGVFLKCG